VVIVSLVTGSFIKKLRTDAGLTQKRLAKLAGVSQAHVAKIEQGKVDPRLSTVNKILRVFAASRDKRSRDVMSKGVIFAKPNESILKVCEVMVKNAVSQLPVLDGNRTVGTITEEGIIRNLRPDLAEERVRKVMASPLPTVSEDTSVDTVRSLLEKNPGVLVTRGREVVGIITRSDLLKTLG
jgi:predicted transcriptional regulator